MTRTNHRNPLFAAVSEVPTTGNPSRQRCHRAAAKVGGYGGVAVAAWLITAVATGYGTGAAETTGASSESSTSSESAAAADDTESDSTSGSDSTSAGGTTAPDTAETEAAASGTTSSSVEVAPGVTIGSSGGAQSDEEQEDDDVEALEPERPAMESETPEVVTPEASGSEPEATPSGSRAPQTAGDGDETAPSSPASTVSTQATSAGESGAAATRAVSTAQPHFAATARVLTTDSVSSALATTTSVTAPAAQPALPGTGFVTLLNTLVTNLLNPFLAPAPNTGDPFTPVAWALLGWVRRNLFNQSPVATAPTTTVQSGQTITGRIDVTDPEGDALTYKVTQQPKLGNLTIDQATGTYTYTPNDINYTAIQEDSFTVSVGDGKFNLLNLFGSRSVQDDVDIDVLNPTVERVILAMPDGITNPVNPRYSADGQSIYFSGTPTAGGRSEIYQIDIDGTDATCLTCGLAAPTIATSDPSLPVNIRKPVPFYDGTGRVVVLLDNPEPRYAIFEPVGYNGVGSPARIVNVFTPGGGGLVILNREREMRPSPDGTHVLFTRIVIGQTGGFQALPIVGELTANGDHYDVTNAVVVWPTGESKQWTPDGKGVIIQGGAIDGGNIDDIMVDLSGLTGENIYPGSPFLGTRVTGNLDYDEDIDMSPNMAWITVGSLRGLEALTPMTRIVRQNFLPVYVGAAIYDQYADHQVRNVSNQNWAIAIEDDLNREDGIPLFLQDDPDTETDEGDGWISRSMPSWNADGTAVTFWESGNNEEVSATESRIVIANLKYTTSVGTVGDTTTVLNSSAFPALETYVAQTTPLPPTGAYSGVRGGTALVSEVVDPTTFETTRTVKYTNYVNEDGLILNGIETAIYGPSQLRVTYLAEIDVTDESGAARGALDANAVVTLLPTQSVSGYITSTLDGDTQTIPDPEKVEDAKTGA